jgi:hypothetical protein
MGANISTSYKESIAKVVNEATKEFVTTVTNNATATGYTFQEIKIVNKGKMKCKGGINVKNINKSKINAISQLSSKLTNELTTKILDAVKNETKVKMDQSNEKLNFGQTNVASDTSKVTTEIDTKLKTTVKNTIENSVTVSSTNKQTIEINNFGTIEGDECNFTNDNIADIISKNVTDAVIDNMAKDSIINDLLSKYELETSQKNVGVSLFDFALIFIVIIGIIYLVFKNGISSLFEPKYLIPIVIIVGVVIALIVLKIV